MVSEYKATLTYNDGSTYDVPLNGYTTLTREEIEAGPKQREEIRSAVIYEGVTELTNPFQYCTGLTCVTIPSSVTEIGQGAFYQCTKLTDVTNDSSITEFYGFPSCENLVSVDMPQTVESVVSLGYAGDYQTRIAEININDIESWCGVSITSSSQDFMKRLFIGGVPVKNLTIPSTVTEIGSMTFSRCGTIETIVIPDTVTTIGAGAFATCSGVKSIIIGSGVTTVGSGAFSGCIPFYLSVDSRSALYDFRKKSNSESSDWRLWEIVIGDNVTGTLPDDIFTKYRALTKITIGSGVTGFGHNDFEYNDNIVSLTVRASSPPVILNGSMLKLPPQANIYVPCGSVEDYKTAYQWRSYESRIFGYDCNQ